jgi:hypothetical protein
MTLKRKVSNTAISNSSCHHHQSSPKYKEEEATEPDPTPTNIKDRPDLTDSDIEDDNEDLVDPDAIYKETKALGDTDREVHIDFLLLWYIFDILQRLCVQRPRMIAHPISIQFSKKSERKFIHKQERRSLSTGALYASTF